MSRCTCASPTSRSTSPPMLGVWLAGGVVVPVHRTSPEGAVAHMIAKTRARFEWDCSAPPAMSEPPPRRPCSRRRARRLHLRLVGHAEGRRALASRVRRQARRDPEHAAASGEGRPDAARAQHHLQLRHLGRVPHAPARRRAADAREILPPSPSWRDLRSGTTQRRGGADDDAQPDPRRAQARASSATRRRCARCSSAAKRSARA